MTVITKVSNLYNASVELSSTKWVNNAVENTLLNTLFLYWGLAHGRPLLVNTRCCVLMVSYCLDSRLHC
jgi:hypothetical protein